MTERLYYSDQRLTEICAEVVDRLEWNGHPAVELDRTAFYPESGGQPSDRGEIDGVAVLDVVVLEDGAVLHVLAGEVAGTRVRGVVDWERRFDHMQQHTGQHILSAAFERLLDAETVGFHIGSDYATIDIEVSRLEVAAAERVENLANRIIWEDRPVTVFFAKESELAAMSLRRAPVVEGPVRIVRVGGGTDDGFFDANPCGGTHVAATGEIGMVKVVRLEYRGNQTRVEFLCGHRALCDYRRKNDTVTKLAGHLTVGHWELEEAVGRIEDEAKGLRRDLAHAEKRIADMEAQALVHGDVPWGPYRLVVRILAGRSAADLRSLAIRLAERPGYVALLAATGDRTHLCFARADDVDVDVASMLRQTCARLDGKGGGRPHLAQGGAGSVDADEVEAVLADVALSYFAAEEFGC